MALDIGTQLTDPVTDATLILQATFIIFTMQSG